MSRARNGTVTTAVVDHGHPETWHGSKASTTVACTSDDQVLEGLVDIVQSHTFTFGRFTEVADRLGCEWLVSAVLRLLTLFPGITNRSGGDIVAIPVSPTSPSEASTDASDVLAALDARLHKLYAAVPPRTALVIFTGHSDPRRMADLNVRKSAFENAIRSGKNSDDVGDIRWTNADARLLEEEVERAKRGLLFLGIKDAK